MYYCSIVPHLGRDRITGQFDTNIDSFQEYRYKLILSNLEIAAISVNLTHPVWCTEL